jgi:hypothetical protein
MKLNKRAARVLFVAVTIAAVLGFMQLSTLPAYATTCDECVRDCCDDINCLWCWEMGICVSVCVISGCTGEPPLCL